MEMIVPHVSTTNVTDMGVSNPIIDGFETVTPTMHVHTTGGESIPHTAPIEGNLVNVPII